MKQNIPKTLFLISLLSLFLSACGSDTPPYVHKLSNNVRAIDPNNSVSVYSQNNYPAPITGQVTNITARFKVIYDLYEDDENRILIPSGTIVAGTYSNDGKSCRIYWKTVYAHGDENMEKRNSVSISHITVPTECNPVTGIKYGDQLVINFTANNIY